MALREGQQAPGFCLEDAAGRAFSLPGSGSARLAALAFFKVDCPVCQLTFPYLDRVYRAAGSQNTLFLGISQDDDDDTRQFRSEFPFAFPSVCDKEPYAVSSQFDVEFVPTIYCIDGAGQVKQVIEGFSKQGLQELADRLSCHAGRPPRAVFKPDEGVPSYRPG